jgi:hypothetical protein
MVTWNAALCLLISCKVVVARASRSTATTVAHWPTYSDFMWYCFCQMAFAVADKAYVCHQPTPAFVLLLCWQPGDLSVHCTWHVATARSPAAGQCGTAVVELLKVIELLCACPGHTMLCELRGPSSALMHLGQKLQVPLARCAASASCASCASYAAHGWGPQPGAGH